MASGRLRWLQQGDRWEVSTLMHAGYVAIDAAAVQRTIEMCALSGSLFDDATYCRHLPAHRSDWAGEIDLENLGRHLGGHPLVPLPHSMQGSRIPTRRLSTHEVVAWLISELSKMRLGPSKLSRLFEEPEHLVRLGYRLARRAARIGPVDSEHFSLALCLAGLGALAIEDDTICEQCYRLNLPGLSRCSVHSQSKLNLDGSSRDRSRQSQSSRLGRSVKQAIHWSAGRPIELLNFSVRGSTFAGMLWSLTGAMHLNWNNEMRVALARAPLVRRLLPSDG
jgi:hypothetical protein